jgi:hypothetical protein
MHAWRPHENEAGPSAIEICEIRKIGRSINRNGVDSEEWFITSDGVDSAVSKKMELTEFSSAASDPKQLSDFMLESHADYKDAKFIYQLKCTVGKMSAFLTLARNEFITHEDNSMLPVTDAELDFEARVIEAKVKKVDQAKDETALTDYQKQKALFAWLRMQTRTVSGKFRSWLLTLSDDDFVKYSTTYRPMYHKNASKIKTQWEEMFLEYKKNFVRARMAGKVLDPPEEYENFVGQKFNDF